MCSKGSARTQKAEGEFSQEPLIAAYSPGLKLTEFHMTLRSASVPPGAWPLRRQEGYFEPNPVTIVLIVLKTIRKSNHGEKYLM